MSSEAPTIFPFMRFTDAPAAMDFLQRAFGFTERARIVNPDGTIGHAELSYGPSILMVGTDPDDPEPGARRDNGALYVAVDDIDEHCRRARAAGAEILAYPYDADYGSRNYTAADLEGNQWHFGTYRPSPQPAATASVG